MNDQVPPPTPAPLVTALLQAAQLLEARMETALGNIGLSYAKFGVLDQLARSPAALTLGEIADRIACVRSNVTQLVDRLEAERLVQRIPDTKDRRMIRAALTEAGGEKQRLGALLMAQIQAEAVASLSDADQAALRWGLRRLG